MFLGQFVHSFDDRGRLTVPSKYRELIKDGAYVLQGLDRNLWVMTPGAFEIITQRLMAMNLMDPLARSLRRLILGNAAPLELDSAGRILIPQNLRDLAGLATEAVLVGQGDYFEVFSQETWKEQEARLREIENDPQRFATLNLSTR